ncbi:MAG: anaerobic ribonucleoside-triphosphate reductase activating protein [Nanobdellota archaeon]
MKIAGYQKTSLQDFPGKIASIIFTQGCNFSCGYCHNPELIPRNSDRLIDEQEIFDHIIQRRNLLDGIVITGGEPTIQPGLYDFIGKLKKYGLLVKLDTNGSNAPLLGRLIQDNMVDYVAMDYKFPVDEYQIIAGVAGTQINASKEVLMNSSIPHEFRVTLVENLFTEERLRKIAEELHGARKICLQRFRNEQVNDSAFSAYRTSTEFVKLARDLFDGEVVLR